MAPLKFIPHGIHHRIFTDDEERILVEEIFNTYIVPG
jgi:hypothetical protein